jgi:hypothetical protein
MEHEMSLIRKNQTWKLEDLLPNKVPITCKWVHKVKKAIVGQLENLKTHLVAQGFELIKGLDFNKTFSPIVKWGTIWPTVTFASKSHWNMFHLDVKTTFLHGDLKEEAYMTQSSRFMEERKEHKFCKLLKSFYKLKQAPRA